MPSFEDDRIKVTIEHKTQKNVGMVNPMNVYGVVGGGGGGGGGRPTNDCQDCLNGVPHGHGAGKGLSSKDTTFLNSFDERNEVARKLWQLLRPRPREIIFLNFDVTSPNSVVAAINAGDSLQDLMAIKAQFLEYINKEIDRAQLGVDVAELKKKVEEAEKGVGG